jgi:molybdenum cofactor biosynthesis enzyme MoaA
LLEKISVIWSNVSWLINKLMTTSTINFYYELEPEKNHFYSVFVDITHKCNMECANCYVPIRTVPDLDVSKLYQVLEKFPKKAEIRLIGGEPTVRTDLVNIVSKIRELGHRPTMMTNGLMLARPGYARELADAGMRSIYISLNGADNDDVYEVMDGVRCADRKIKGWQACQEAHMNINLGAILQKGCNDDVPGRLLELSKQIGGNPIFRFRNVGQVGRFALEKDQNWTFEEMTELVCRQFNKDIEWAKQWTSINGYTEKNVLFFPLDESKKMKTPWVKITNWSPAGSNFPDPGNQRRGRLTQDFKLAPFFEHVKMYENVY